MFFGAENETEFRSLSSHVAPFTGPRCTFYSIASRSHRQVSVHSKYVRSLGVTTASRDGPSLPSAPNSKISHRVSVSEVSGLLKRLRSARRRQLSVPRVHRSTFGSRAFSVARPAVWNSLPADLHSSQLLTPNIFGGT